MHFSLLDLLVGALAFSSSIHAFTIPTNSSVIYWGQNLAKSSFPRDTEKSLAVVCQTTPHNIIHIKGIVSYATVKGYPGIDFNNHCSFPLNIFYGWPTTSPNGLSLINCPDIGKDIKTCQGMGKKIILVIDPLDFMQVDDSTKPNFPLNVANHIWNLFLGGTSQFRPFGTATVDGLDFHIWSENPNGILDLASELKQMMGSQYIFAASAKCSYPDYLINPTDFPVLSQTFDYVIAFFLSDDSSCGYNGNNPGFWTTVHHWSDFAGSMPLLIGLPTWPTQPTLGSTTGDYITAQQFQADGVVQSLQAYPNFNGFAFLDYSYDSINLPCLNDAKGKQRTYAQFVNQQLNLPANGNGPNTVGTYLCLNYTPTTAPPTTAPPSLNLPPTQPPAAAAKVTGGNAAAPSDGLNQAITTTGGAFALQISRLLVAVYVLAGF